MNFSNVQSQTSQTSCCCLKLNRQSPVGFYAEMVRVSVLSLEPQMVFLCLKHAGAVYHILYLRAGDATPRHAFIKESLAAVALNRAFDNTACLLMRQVLAATSEFTLCFLLPSFSSSFSFSLPPSLRPAHSVGQRVCSASVCWLRKVHRGRGLLGNVVAVKVSS